MTEDGKHLAFPFHIGMNGKTVQTSSLEEHVKQELIQFMLTNNGERLFLPEFGGGARSFVFENFDEHRAGVAKSFLAQGISKWLGHRINVEDLKVTVDNNIVNINLKYKIAGTDDTLVLTLQHLGR